MYKANPNTMFSWNWQITYMCWLSKMQNLGTFGTMKTVYPAKLWQSKLQSWEHYSLVFNNKVRSAKIYWKDNIRYPIKLRPLTYEKHQSLTLPHALKMVLTYQNAWTHGNHKGAVMATIWVLCDDRTNTIKYCTMTLWRRWLWLKKVEE